MNSDLEKLIAKFPTPADDGKLANPDSQGMAEAIEQLVKLGSVAAVGLIDMLVDDSRATDTQARHALHALAVHAGSSAGKDVRGELALALASTLASDRPIDIKAFVIRQLQVCGGSEATETLGKLLGNDELAECAAQALLAIGASASHFRRALAESKSNAVRLTIVQALGVLRDVDAAGALREVARVENGEVRLAAISSLVNLGQPTDVELLISATKASGFERAQAVKACLLLAEKLQAAGKKEPAAQIYEHLRSTPGESEAYIRQAAERGLAAIQ
jgi:hypothetical protein